MDPHLNLFYSYNRDNELIENNLTRAWIVTLRLLSGETRNQLLQALLELPIQDLGRQIPFFDNAQLALQGYFDTQLLPDISQKFIITIATERENEVESGVIEETSIMGESIPDAWIFDPNKGYCFLVEAKIGTNPIDSKQVYNHATQWLGIPKKQVKKCLISLNWHDFLKAIQLTIVHCRSPQEEYILQDFAQFISFNGYRLFSGFDFCSLDTSPDFSLLHV